MDSSRRTSSVNGSVGFVDEVLNDIFIVLEAADVALVLALLDLAHASSPH
jgi:hypothetical protein